MPAYLTEHTNLVFDISLASWGTVYEPYFPALQNILDNFIAFNSIEEDTCWSMFILQDIPMNTAMDEISSSFSNNYWELTFDQALRRLIMDETKLTIKKDGTLKQLHQ